ncbi:trypsin-like peptidase domain-containing protein [Chamaesiphon sp. GL140_3_metabinner_50]|uniref:tetratricopeptide repeat-containing S1 family peptidase n=1 Tax=Chamaesiphon sp. GL140_3_metabinner_50 TaxID=2970812 RepID=UPI0025F2ECDE|nr:trypsin-like peptidase domain-containing protein [Chamaesiphon sp. GL140_3_metabinner_50]
MLPKISQWTRLIGISATIALVQPNIAAAKSSVEIADIGKAITVSISTPESLGSGVILQHQGNIYTILTTASVVKDRAKYKITTPDNRSYEAISSSIRTAPGNIDLAIIKFKSTANYLTAKLGNCNILESGMSIYVNGFPGTTKAITESVFLSREGQVSANSTRVLENGYSLIYSNQTLPGMNGGAILNSDGELVAIHGKSDKDDNGNQTGLNLGIPINQFGMVARNMGIELDGKVAPIQTNTAAKAGDYFASAVPKIGRGDSMGGLTDLDRAIQLNPNYALAYSLRGALKAFKLIDTQGGLADFNRAIALDPRFSLSYQHRGMLKALKLNDIQGALADYSRAILLDSKNATTYVVRGTLKATKLNDIQGGVADLDRAISLDPNNADSYSLRGVFKATKLNDTQGGLADLNRAISIDSNNAMAFKARSVVKYMKLNDRAGGIADMKQSARLSKKQGDLAEYQLTIDQLKAWGITSNSSGF